MDEIKNLDKIAISVRSHKLLNQLLRENKQLSDIMRRARNETEALVGVRNLALDELKKNQKSYDYFTKKKNIGKILSSIESKDIAAIRILDYIENAGREFIDLNLRGKKAVSNPIKLIWLGVTYGTGGAKPDFYEDMVMLFRQFRGEMSPKKPPPKKVIDWMNRYVSGLDTRIIRLCEENKERILNKIIQWIESGKVISKRFGFEENLSHEQKFLKVLEWWDDWKFHIRFAVRNPEDLNELLGNSLDPDTINVLKDAEKKGIPFFINPYYLSLIQVRAPYFAIGSDLPIRDYIFYSKQLIEEFGHIVAWEKEDIVQPGKPNAAGWILPGDRNVHRRYPEVAILIPDSMGRACGGLCSSCQRMYDFQRGHLNFDLEKLKPGVKWKDKQKKFMDYFRYDSQLRDILITGGDSLMSSDKFLRELFDAIYEMAISKRSDNKKRKNGLKYAEIVRVRLGTRLLAYLPQRVTHELCNVLTRFREKALKAGIKQFIIQTHFESPLEITMETETAVKMILDTGWIVTNQHVYTASASRRGHNAKLRKTLNDIGILCYYTFSVKGYMENFHSFTPIARSVQEQREEKYLGKVDRASQSKVMNFPQRSRKVRAYISDIRKQKNIPFLASDRSVLNLPGVGKSLTFRVIGITRYGRRILEFDHDKTRKHSPVINKMGKVVIIESKTISEYLKQIREMGEDIEEYEDLYCYSIGNTEARMGVFEYPDYEFETTDEFTNLEI